MKVKQGSVGRGFTYYKLLHNYALNLCQTNIAEFYAAAAAWYAISFLCSFSLIVRSLCFCFIIW